MLHRHLKAFLPNDYNIERIPRDFIFTLFKTAAPTIYDQLKKMAEKVFENNKLSKFSKISVKINSEYSEVLDTIPNQEVK
jgi:hypothetical protein